MDELPLGNYIEKMWEFAKRIPLLFLIVIPLTILYFILALVLSLSLLIVIGLICLPFLLIYYLYKSVIFLCGFWRCGFCEKRFSFKNKKHKSCCNKYVICETCHNKHSEK